MEGKSRLTLAKIKESAFLQLFTHHLSVPEYPNPSNTLTGFKGSNLLPIRIQIHLTSFFQWESMKTFYTVCTALYSTDSGTEEMKKMDE